MIAFNDGEDRDSMRSLVTADESLIFVHRGKVYRDRPIRLTASTELWARPLRKIGFAVRRDFILAAAQQRQRDADRFPGINFNTRANRRRSSQHRSCAFHSCSSGVTWHVRVKSDHLG
jgi:hypothetical protein